MSAAVRFELAPSRVLAAGIVAAHAAAAIAVLAVLPGLTGGLLSGALLALGVAAAWSRALLRSAGSVRAIEIGGPQPVFELAKGERFSASLSARRYVSRHFVALPYKLASATGRPFGRTLLATADMLGPREFRRFRIWALWNRLPAQLPAVAPKQLPA